MDMPFVRGVIEEVQELPDMVLRLDFGYGGHCFKER